MFLELVVLLISIVLAYDYLSKKRVNDVLSYMPGPRSLPLVGNILAYVGQTPEDIFNLISSNRQKYGPLYRVWIFNRPAVFCADPKDVEVILNSSKHITKNSLYDMLVDWLGYGLLISTGQKWHSRRKVITPTFHFKILEQFVEVFDQQGKELLEAINDKADGKTAFDIYPFICRMALDVIAETSMGTKVYAQKNPNIGYVRAVSDITALFSKRLLKAWYRLDIPFKILEPGLYKKQTETIKKMHDFTENVIQKRRAALEKEIVDGKFINQMNTNDDIGINKKMALLDVLLQSTIDGKPLSNEDIREEVDTFMFEGHDTTTSAMSFTLFLISRHPEVQNKAFEEIRDVIGEDTTKSITLHDLNNLKYLECVIKEGLRLYPPVPLIGRRFQEDTEINGKKIPAGTDFTIGIYVMLRDGEYFPKPNDFIPERHLAENTAEKSNPYAYIPFSAGPRNCIGQKFAILEMKSTISKILRNYELLPLGEHVRPMMNLVTRSVNGVQVGLKPRV
ncbi:cytochrome P450 4d2-like [Episyrphus balteatus]|uniref:cytochrome P450 4d2-like n=1 Tax=Episyrphus balteatus TaxID=286459 RepID=UPI0024850F26|nr:cytochrome P450 4d2-like [Episyrphus balteatus]XP_055857582.1 cytochrome P450 4d2-like [Episyrphus balteatus]XP_055857583.1 cytochrome P450 4d2-like [Episyrphus balteatus]